MGERPDPRNEDESDFEWISFDESTSNREPRTGAGGWGPQLGIVVTVLLVAIGGMALLTPSAVAQTSFTANDAYATSHNGQLKELSVAPEGTVTYEGLEKPASKVTITAQAKLTSSSTWTDVTTKDIPTSGYSGSVAYNFTREDLLKLGGFTRNDFRPADGTNKTTQVDIRIVAVVHEESGQTVSTEGKNTFEVEVKNIGRNSGVGGDANTNAS